MLRLELSVHVEPIHCDDSSGALLDETASDWEQNLRRSRISLGNWSFTPKSVPFSSLPRLFTCSFCLKYPNLATIGRGLGAPGFFAPIRWTLSKQMFSTVSSGSFRYVLIKFLTVASGSSSADSGMPENTRLSLMLRAWRSMTVSFIFLFSSLRWVIFSVRD